MKRAYGGPRFLSMRPRLVVLSACYDGDGLAKMSGNPEILIGNSGSNYVRFHMIGRPNSEGWFSGAVEVQCDGWMGRFRGCFQKGELRRFAEELKALKANLGASAKLDPMEPNIKLSIAGDGKGHLAVQGEACNTLGSETFLTFEFEIDQTYLGGIAEGLLAVDPT